jgi:peptide/nickel transport system substrate-binding protein
MGAQKYGFGPGDQVASGRFTISEFLASGANGDIYRVRDEVLGDDDVVLKVLHKSLNFDEDTKARFEREFLIARKLSHPAIPTLYELGTLETGQMFMALEYIPGETLEAKIKDGKLGFVEKLYVLYQLSDVLAYAHQRQTVHRDLKPANVLLNSELVLKLTDFGIARQLHADSNLTKTGDGLGTPVYMAPEQMNAKAVDHRADLYSLGIIAFELASGKPPFIGNNWMQIVAKHVSEPLPSLIEAGVEVPLWYDDMVQKCCAKAPSDRISSAAELRDLLAHRLLDEEPSENFELSEIHLSRLSVQSAKADASKILSARVSFLALGAVLGVVAVLGFPLLW